MEPLDARSRISTSLRYAGAGSLVLNLLELCALLSRSTVMPLLLPTKIIAVHTCSVIPAAAGIALLDRLLSRLAGRRVYPGWMIWFALLIVLSGEGRLQPLAMVVGVTAILLMAGATIRRRAPVGEIGPLGFSLAVILAGLLAKGSLLARGGWGNVGWALLWLLLAWGLQALSLRRERPRWRRFWIGGLVLLAALPAASLLLGAPQPPRFAPRGSPAPDSANIVLIVLDTVRADAFDDWEGGPLFPRLERYAAGTMERLTLTAPSPSSLPSHATLFTGLPAYAHGAHKPWTDDPDPPSYAYPLGESAVTVAERLAAAGYATAGVSGNFGPLAPKFGLAQGFSYYDARRNEASRLVKKMLLQRVIPIRRLLEQFPFPVFGYEAATPYRTAEVIVDRALELLELLRGQRWFLFVNIFDAHSPYLPPDYWRLRRELPGSDWIHDGEPSPEDHRAITTGRRTLSPEEVAYLRALYRSQARYIDRHLARLLAAIDRDSTLLLVLSDHGESLGDHGMLKHSTTLFRDQVEVPCLIGYPRAPGLRELAQGPRPRDFLDLHDLLLRAGGLVPPERPRPPGVVSEVYSAEHPRSEGGVRKLFTAEVRALVQGSLKLIWFSDGRLELFDTRRDPGETRDLAAERSETARRMSAALQEYLQRFDSSAGRSSPAAELDESDLEALRTLGYIQ
jgi:arylsulfatase A-like enzyme